MDGQEREAGPLLKEEAGEKGSQALRKWFQQLRMKERNQEVFAPSPAGPASRPWSLLPSRLSPFPLTAHGLPLGPHVPVWDVVGNELTVPVATLFPVCSGGPHSPPSARSGVGSRPRPGPGGPASRASPPSSSAPHPALPADPEGRSATPRGSAQTQRGLQSPHTPGASASPALDAFSGPP